MTQAPTTVWNEVRFTSEGISISLFSESPDSGAILEDEMWYTYDELQEMAPSEPLSLNLSDESEELLSEQRQEAVVGNLLQSENEDPTGGTGGEPTGEDPDGSIDVATGQNEVVHNLPTVGDVVRDDNPPSWSRDNWLEVVEVLPDVSADEYIIQSMDESRINSVAEESNGHIAFHEKTVADANPSCEPDEPVIECVYRSDRNPEGTYDESDVYAFPLSRIEDR